MTYLSIISSGAKSVGISAYLLWSVCAHESRDFTLDYAMYDNGSPSFSVCQIKKDTAILMGWRGKNEMELRNPYVGIKYAALYLKYQQQRYGDDWIKIVSSYNAGSYIEGKVRGCPRNLKYLRLVQEKMSKEFKNKLECKK